MSEMVERVADILCDLSYNLGPQWDASSDRTKNEFRGYARAAIEAMRDCDAGTPAMLVAGKKALISCSEDPELEDARKCWQAMIDAALK